MHWYTNRVVIVLGILALAMSGVSGLLLCLEPRPIAPNTEVILAANEAHRAPEDALFDTVPDVEPGRWSAIVIHSSGTPTGNARTLDQQHQRFGLPGVGYHFVVSNGKGGPDGQIEKSFRWRHQMAGAHSRGANGAWYNQHALGICLVGDAKQPPTRAQVDKLAWLVRQLQARLRIPADRVVIQFDTPTSPNTPGAPGSPNAPATATHFPVAAFRQQLQVTDGR